MVSPAQQTLDELAAAVTNMTTVADSAEAALNGVSARITAAVDEALALGATPAMLEPITTEIAALNAKASSLAAAVEANT
jgi:hypothetical protein